jgi:hypothetical protein
MSGFPADFSEDIGETEAEIKEAIQNYERKLKRPLTGDEKEYMELSYTDPDTALKFSKQHPGLFK